MSTRRTNARGRRTTPPTILCTCSCPGSYLKKITPQSLRMSGEQKYKEGDGPGQQAEATNAAEVMFFTDRCQVYKTRLSEFGDSKASVLGDYLPAKLGMDEGESVVYMVLPGDYSGHLLFFFENGKAARVEMKAYATVSNRRKLTGAYSDKSRLVAILPLAEDRELTLLSTEPRALIFHTSLLLPKATRSTQGVAVMTLKPKYQLQRVCTPEESGIVNLPRYRARSIPGTGALLRPEDRGRGAADPAVRKKGGAYETERPDAVSHHHGVLRPVCRGVQLDV